MRLSKLSLLPNNISPFFISEPFISSKVKIVLGTMCIEPKELENTLRQFMTVGGLEIDCASGYKGVEVEKNKQTN